jgi:hypothetical protein
MDQGAAPRLAVISGQVNLARVLDDGLRHAHFMQVDIEQGAVRAACKPAGHHPGKQP